MTAVSGLDSTTHTVARRSDKTSSRMKTRFGGVR
jgi:hypothetical protein